MVTTQSFKVHLLPQLNHSLEMPPHRLGAVSWVCLNLIMMKMKLIVTTNSKHMLSTGSDG